MNIVDGIQFGPFNTEYHRSLVDATFASALNSFLDANLVTQLDSSLTGADGTLSAVYGRDSNCGVNSLVRDIFRLDVVLYCEDGNAELKADIVFDPCSQTFASRKGFLHDFYVWTPARKRRREGELTAIQTVVDEIQVGHRTNACCPICNGNLKIVDDSLTFDVRCGDNRCFNYNYHKDDDGRLLHGHFFILPPTRRR